MDNYTRAILNISQTQDGIDFLEYLEALSKLNYEAFKKDDRNEFHKGYAVAVDAIIQVFKTASDIKPNNEVINSWS